MHKIDTTPELPPEGAPKKKLMSLDSIGALLLAVGVGIAALGGVLLLISRVPVLNQLFNLPGDIRIQKLDGSPDDWLEKAAPKQPWGRLIDPQD